MAKRHTRDDCPFRDEIAVLLTDQNRMKQDLQEIKQDLKAFIERADNTYAKKEELQDLKLQLKETTRTVWDLIQRWGPLILITVYIVLQGKGIL